MENYKLFGFRKSKTKNKKYDGILIKEGKKVYVPFGDIRYEQYHDLTKLNLYKSHNDKTRRASYQARHKKDLRDGYYSPGYFSYFYLW
jgi:hypothetical protein